MDRLCYVSGHVAEETALNLHEAANYTSRYLLKVARGAIHRPDRWMIRGAEIVLDRAGLGPIRMDHAPHLRAVEVEEPLDLDALTDNELAQLATGDLSR